MKDKIYIPKTKIAVTPILDYYGTNQNNSKINTNIKENQTFDIGVIEAVGDEQYNHLLGKVVFHTKGFGSTVNIPDLGKFKIVDMELVTMVLLDQDINNYKK